MRDLIAIVRRVFGWIVSLGPARRAERRTAVVAKEFKIKGGEGLRVVDYCIAL